MGANLQTSSDWQRVRAIELHDTFTRIERIIANEGRSLASALDEASLDLMNKSIQCRDGSVKVIKASFTTLKTHYYRWKESGRKAAALLHDYQPGRAQTPPKLIAELQRRSTLPGMANISVVIKSLQDDWNAGKEIPGLGTWQDWWIAKYPTKALPHKAPDFPVSERTLYRAKPSKRERAYGNKGIAAGRGEGPFVNMDYSKLKKCELFTLDDVRLDILCIDETTGKAIEVVCYILMEVASRSIVAYILKPAAAIKQEDVDELLAYGLQSWGIGSGYTTHIKFERGTVACSEAAQKTLEAATEGAIKIHRTSVDGGIRWVGAPRDKASGHAAGKAVIESFNRKLHLMLMGLPGQRGNKFENQPANLGYEGKDKITPGSLADECQKLAQFELLANAGKDRSDRIRLKLAMLYLREVDQAFRDAIKAHNTEPGHDYSGHGEFIEREIAPGVWDDADEQPTTLRNLTPALVRPDEPQASASSDHAPTSAGAVSKPAKVYVLKNGPKAKPTIGEYWRRWQELDALFPNQSNLRHALTARTLGCHPKVKDMTPDQLSKMIDVFSAIVRDTKAKQQ